MGEIVPQEILTEDSWLEARRIAGLVSNVSALFSTAIRFLRKDADSGAQTMSHSSTYCVQRLLNSASFKAPVYFAALSFKPDLIANEKYISPQKLAHCFTPAELANLIGLLYLYRRVQKACDETEWQELAKLVQSYGDLGGQVGLAMPNISLGSGILLGSIRHLALGLFLGIDKKLFIQYRRNLKLQKQIFNLPEETKLWGCNHVQVASILVQSLGLGGDASKALTTALLLVGIPDKDLPQDAFKLRIAWTWMDALRATGAPPQITHRGDFYPLKPDLEKLIARTEVIRKNGCTYPFFSKGKDDISPSTTPVLFEKTTIVEEESLDDLPSEVVEQFSDKNVEVEDL